ncbi:hypothetical protein [Sporichthya polymorpha]|uniref:hypothetical protein n=1 Tax=Sporichthya polymorpha TaxID=35751 RepID=UPI0003650051|nr:hypothetical protein [Sporichthya polymorpha]
MRSPERWFFPLVPNSRIVVLRAAIYLFVVVDVLVMVNDVVPKAAAGDEFFQPVLLARLLQLPAPAEGPLEALRAFLVVAALVAATGRLPRLLGWPIAVGHLVWVLYGMSYGKVDHDHLALVVALFVLPTVGRAHPHDHRADERAGWALRCVQIAVVATYTLSVWAKVRYGGWDWPSGATLLWAVERRGTFLGEHLVHVPELLVVAQWVTVVAELAAPLALVLRGRALGLAAGFYLGFHLTTYAVISIHFLPLVVCWLAFAPLEKVAQRWPGVLVPRVRGGWPARSDQSGNRQAAEPPGSR